MKIMSAPALAYASPRRIASSRPSAVRASVRAMIRKSLEERASLATVELVDHFLDGDHVPVRRVAAFLGVLLILELDRRRSRLLVATNCMVDVEQATVTGIAIGDQRLAHGLDDGLHAIEHLGVRRQSSIGQSEVGRHDPVARHVERVGLGTIGELGGDQVEDPGTGHKRRFLDHRFLRCWMSSRSPQLISG